LFVVINFDSPSFDCLSISLDGIALLLGTEVGCDHLFALNRIPGDKDVRAFDLVFEVTIGFRWRIFQMSELRDLDFGWCDMFADAKLVTGIKPWIQLRGGFCALYAGWAENGDWQRLFGGQDDSRLFVRWRIRKWSPSLFRQRRDLGSL